MERMEKTKCAFCEGEGRDPFGLLSPPSLCQVCSGRGEVTVILPAIKCVFCKGTGVYRDQRLSCTVCGGKGLVTIKEPSEECHNCRGSGVSAGNYMPCINCKGKGVVAVRKNVALRR